MPSGKNLMRYDAYADANAAAGIRADGGLDITLKQSFRAWYAITWRTQLSDAGLAAGDTITASCAGLIAHHYMSIRFQRGGDLIGETPYLAIDRPFVSTSIPDGTTQIVTQLFTDADFTEDRHFTIHPQLERGSARTCWEPPEKLRGGGTIKDLNLAPAWKPAPNNPQGMTYTVDGHRLSIGIPYTVNRWVTWYSQRVAFPAGVYTVYGTGSRWDAFTIYNDRNTILTRVDRLKILLTLSSETTLELHVGWEPKGSQIDANFTPVILEGDWTTT